MKTRLFFIAMLMLACQAALACPVCESRQPAPLRGITHGTGPESNWDWLIVGIMTVITVLSLFWSVRYLLYPERDRTHFKNAILD